MRPSTSAVILTTLLYPFALCAQESEEPGAIDRFTLPNGIRAIAVHVPGAEKQCTFTFLPLSLATDPASRGQWSHLLEHMIIRSTDAEGLVAGGVEFNGETQPTSLRLDTYAQPDSFRESFEKHARWLAADAFDSAVLAREKQVIASEEQTVAQGHYTHKFAVAAWNQIVRHGADHAAVHGDVAGAKIAEVAAFAARALAVDDSVLVATIGPVESAEVRPALEETIGRVPQRERDDVDAQATKAPTPAGALEGSWDLPTRHLLLWWNLPDDSPSTRALALTIEMSIMQAAPAAGGGPVLPAALFHLPEGPILLINAALTADQNADAERDRLIGLVNSIAASPREALTTAGMLAREMSGFPDFDQHRRTLPAANRAYLEGQWMLAIAQYEFLWNRPLDEITAALQTIDQAAAEAAARGLAQPPQGSLLLIPRD